MKNRQNKQPKTVTRKINLLFQNPLKLLDKWQIALFSGVLIFVAALSILTLREYSDYRKKSAEYRETIAQAEQYNAEAQRLDSIINHEGSNYDDYMEGKLRANGYGRPGEVWLSGSNFGE